MACTSCISYVICISYAGMELVPLPIDAEVKIGELMREIPKAQGVRTELGNTAVTKLETLESAGINKMTANRFEQMSKHPEAVVEAKISKIPTLGVLKKGKPKKLLNRNGRKHRHLLKQYIRK